MEKNLKEPLLINSGNSSVVDLDNEELPPLVSRFNEHGPSGNLSPRDMLRNTVELLSQEARMGSPTNPLTLLLLDTNSCIILVGR